MQYDYKAYAKHYDKRETDNRYNWKYRTALREGDKRVLSLLRELSSDKTEVALIDLGCGNGNFLKHMTEQFPDWSLSGSDLAEALIRNCQQDPELEGVRFHVGDLTEMPDAQHQGRYDFVVLIAVLQVLPPDVLKQAIACIGAYLKKGGYLINFDGYYPYSEHQSVRIEVTAEPGLHTDLPTMNYHYHSYGSMRAICLERGFSSIDFEPFYMPFDIPRPVGNPAATHTEELADERRLSMLGVVAQPWCFLKAQKA